MMNPRTTRIPIVLKEKNWQETYNRQEDISFFGEQTHVQLMASRLKWEGVDCYSSSHRLWLFINSLTIFVDCYAPAINFTEVNDYSANSKTYVTSVFRSFKCKNGHTIINSTSEIICYADGKWTPDTVCAKGNKKQMIARCIFFLNFYCNSFLPQFIFFIEIYSS